MILYYIVKYKPMSEEDKKEFYEKLCQFTPQQWAGSEPMDANWDIESPEEVLAWIEAKGKQWVKEAIDRGISVALAKVNELKMIDTRTLSGIDDKVERDLYKEFKILD